MLKALKQGSICILFYDNLFEPIPELSLMQLISSVSASDLKELDVRVFANESLVSSLSVHHALPHCPLLYYHCTSPVGYTKIVEVR